MPIAPLGVPARLDLGVVLQGEFDDVSEERCERGAGWVGGNPEPQVVGAERAAHDVLCRRRSGRSSLTLVQFSVRRETIRLPISGSSCPRRRARADGA
jgi:hypothetical protein